MLSNDVVIPPPARSENKLRELVHAKADRRRRRSRLGRGGLVVAACVLLVGVVLAANNPGSGSSVRMTGNGKQRSSASSPPTTILGVAPPGDAGLPLAPVTSPPAPPQSLVFPPPHSPDESSPEPTDPPSADEIGRAPDTTTVPPLPQCSPADVVAVASVDKATYRQGEKITVTGTVTNVSSHPCDPPCGGELSWNPPNSIGFAGHADCTRALAQLQPWMPGQSIPTPLAGPVSFSAGEPSPGTYSAVISWGGGTIGSFTATTPPFEVLPA